jgi:hypothetical protein
MDRAYTKRFAGGPSSRLTSQMRSPHLGGCECGAVMDIVVWLRSLGLAQYEATLREHEIDETVF